jgi:hypothetical protein
MDNVQNCDSYINIPSSQTYRSYQNLDLCYIACFRRNYLLKKQLCLLQGENFSSLGQTLSSMHTKVAHSQNCSSHVRTLYSQADTHPETSVACYEVTGESRANGFIVL